MRLFDLLRSARFIVEARVRAALTLLGIVIGTGSIVLLASLLRGGEEALVRANQQAIEADLIQVRRDDVKVKDRKRTRRELSRDDAQALASLPALSGASALSESVRVTEARVAGKKKRISLVSGAPAARSLYGLDMALGRFVNDADLQGRRRVCVVGHEVWRDLFGGRDALVQTARPDGSAKGAEGAPDAPAGSVEGLPRVTIERHSWTVIGVLADRPMMGSTDSTNIWNRKVLVPETTYDALLSPSHEATRLYVRRSPIAAVTTPMDSLRGLVEATLLRRHLGVKNFKIGEDEGASQEKAILDVVKLLLLSTGLIALLVGGINIMNIMLVTVTDRTREIGIRRAVGASPRAILAQFLLEAGAVSLLGGAVGVLAGLGLARLFAAVLTEVFGRWTFYVEVWSIALGLGLSAITGVVFGLYPALRASRLAPVEALRAE